MPRPSRTLPTAFALAAFVALVVMGRPDPQGAWALSTATIQTDRADYQPFTQVTISGTGWLPGETVSMLFHETGQTPDQYTDPDFTLTTVAHSDGTIYYTDFWTDWHDVGVTFTLTATGLTSGLTAATSFTDAGSGDLDQCANGGNVKPWSNCTASDEWQNGNLGQAGSHYYEGDSVPYRMRFSGLDTAVTHTVTIGWDTEKTANHHAIDYLTTYNRTMTSADPCAGVLGCSGSPSTFPIPLDPHVAQGTDGTPGTGDDITQITGNFSMWGAVITAVSGYTYDFANADSPAQITITFTASVTNPVLAWGGHIATRRDWGSGHSTIAISGSPYHMRFIDLDGKGGNQDRSLSADAVFYPIELTIVKQTDPDTAPSTAFGFTTTGTFADTLGGVPATNPSFTLTPPNGTTAVQRIFYLPDETARTVTESDPSPTFALSNLACVQTNGGLGTGTVTTDLPTRTASITPKEGEYITCTYTNQLQVGSIKIEKVTVPSGSSQSFTFTTTGTGFANSFSLTDGQSNTTGNLVPGTGYSVSESVPTGWDQTSATCDHGTISAIQVIANTTTTCTFTNTQRGSITIVKDTVPNDPQDFSFTSTTSTSTAIGSFSLDDDADATLSNSQTFSDLKPGSYTVTEGAQSGFDLTDLSCTTGGSGNIGTRTASVTLTAGASVTCTFTNTKRGSITLVKDAVPDDPQDFVFAAGGGLTPTSVTLDDDADATLSNTYQFLNVAPGTYSLSESVPTGWDQTGAVCSDGSPVSAIVVSAGEQITCTFTNTKRGSITITKDTVPNDGQDFAFTSTTGTSTAIGGFSLDDDADATLPNTRTFTDLKPGSYTVTEGVVSGFDLTSLTCGAGGTGDLATRTASITLPAGGSVSCTFTNTKRGSIVLVKDAIPNDPQDFVFTAGGGLTPTSVTLDDDADPTLPNTHTFTNVAPGTYSLAESVPAGWSQTGAVCSDGSPVSAIEVSAGESITCTFTNTRHATIIVEKQTLPDASAGSFTFTGDAAGSIGDNGQIVVTGLLPGAYSSTEADPTPGFDLTSITCDDANSTVNLSTRTATFNVEAGETVKCTFTNTKRGTIVVVKDAIPNDAQDFLFAVGGGLTPTSFSLDDDANATLSNTQTFSNVLPGSGYSVSETVPSGWSQTGVTCSDGSPASNISLSAGETVTCTFTNTKQAMLTVKKVMVGGTDTFPFTSAVGGLAGNITVSGGTLSALVDPGVYTAAESAVTGWALTSISCDDPTANSSGNLTTRTASFNAAAGESITCTFTNTKLATLIVEKQTVPDAAPGTFTFTGNASGSIGDGGQITVSGLLPGAYTSTEADPTPNFDLTGIACSDGNSVGSVGSRQATFNLEAGEVVKCTFTNRQRGEAKVIKTFNGATLTGTDAFTFQLRKDASSVAAGTTLETLTANAGNAGVITFTTKLVPGATYQLCEQMQAGWLTTLGPPLYSVFNPSGDNSVVCTDFTVNAGETKEFAINNQPPPGGMSLTIGYWKNWASCANSNGKQAPMLDRAVNLRTIVYGDLVLVDSNGQVDVASDCAALVNLLNKVAVDGKKKMSSDPIFNMVAQLVATDLNLYSGAGLSANAVSARTLAFALLDAVDFNGKTHKVLTPEQVALANCLATALDQSNNNKTVQSCSI